MKLNRAASILFFIFFLITPVFAQAPSEYVYTKTVGDRVTIGWDHDVTITCGACGASSGTSLVVPPNATSITCPGGPPSAVTWNWPRVIVATSCGPTPIDMTFEYNFRGINKTTGAVVFTGKTTDKTVNVLLNSVAPVRVEANASMTIAGVVTTSGWATSITSGTVDGVARAWSLNVAAAIPVCTSFTYSAWSVCSPEGGQTRTVLTSVPAGCAGGAVPILTQTCTPPPPPGPVLQGIKSMTLK